MKSLRLILSAAALLAVFVSTSVPCTVALPFSVFENLVFLETREGLEKITKKIEKNQEQSKNFAVPPSSVFKKNS